MAGCSEDWFETLSAWHDGEVTRDDARRVEAHLATCAVCRQDQLRLASLSADLRKLSAIEVPVTLRGFVEERAGRSTSKRRWPWLALVAALSLVAAAAFAFPRRGLPASVAQEIVQRHLGGFARARPCDIESADPKQVSSWLAEHAGYPVEVPVAEDMDLIGGRMCHLCGAPTAAVMLRHAGTPVTIFVPAPNSDAARRAARLAGDGLGCERGPLGSSICACNTPQPMLAVAESDPERVSAALLAAALP
jgi:anti-sigma factor RsiW